MQLQFTFNCTKIKIQEVDSLFSYLSEEQTFVRDMHIYYTHCLHICIANLCHSLHNNFIIIMKNS